MIIVKILQRIIGRIIKSKWYWLAININDNYLYGAYLSLPEINLRIPRFKIFISITGIS